MKFTITAIALAATCASALVTVDPNHLPHQSESGQTGYNDCGTRDSPSAQCQTLYVNSGEDFCLFAPPKKASVGEVCLRLRNDGAKSERYEVAYCTKKGHGARLMPKGTLKSVHFVQTPHYIQITGTGDFTKLNIPRGDDGGELDPNGADGKGNPIGGVVLSTISGRKQQMKQWTEFISDTEFCIRACFVGDRDWQYCNHIYDVMGCYWNIPGSYNSGFETCKSDSTPWPMGLYPNGNGGTSTFYQGQGKTPSAWAAPKSSQCSKLPKPTGASY